MISHSASNPRPGNTGVSHPQNPPESPKTDIGISATIDWFSLSGPDFQQPEARHIFELTYPGSELQPRGRHGYQSMLMCPLTSAALMWDDSAGKGRYTLELSGQACQWLGTPSEVLSPWKPLYPSVTNILRIDLAIDLIGDYQHAIPSLIDSHRSGCVNPPLVGHIYDQFDPKTNQTAGQTYYLGSIKSDKRVKLYDKGLQTGEFEAGKWIRWESTFKNQVGVQVFQRLLEDPSEENIRNMAAGVITAVSGPFAKTYELLSEAPLRLSRKLPERTVGKSLAHLHKQLQVVVEAARLIGEDPHQLLRHFDLLEPIETCRNPRRDKLAREIICQYTLDQD